MSRDRFLVRRMGREEVEIAVDWAEQEGWNPGIHDAEEIFLTLSAQVPGEAIYLDTPEPNAEAVALARRHGMVAVFETARI